VDGKWRSTTEPVDYIEVDGKWRAVPASQVRYIQVDGKWRARLRSVDNAPAEPPQPTPTTRPVK
jgi:hypothetical protein